MVATRSLVDGNLAIVSSVLVFVEEVGVDFLEYRKKILNWSGF